MFTESNKWKPPVKKVNVNKPEKEDVKYDTVSLKSTLFRY